MKINKVAAIMLSVVLSACAATSYTSYDFEQLKAAEYTLPDNIKKVVLVDCSGKTVNEDDTFVSSDTAYLSARIKALRNIPSMMCSMVMDKINSSGFISVVIDKEKVSFGDVILTSKEIAERHQADAIIALTEQSYHGFMEGSYDVNGQLNLVSALRSEFKFVMPNGAYRDFEVLNDTLRWVSDNPEDVFPDYNEVYYSIVELSGRHFAGQIVPCWTKRRRYVLSSPSRDMQDAVMWVSKDEWEKARDIWAEQAVSGKDDNKVRASINIGLFYEREDNPQEAAMWFSKSIDIIQNSEKLKKSMSEELRMAERLFGRQIERQSEKLDLDKQMGAE